MTDRGFTKFNAIAGLGGLGLMIFTLAALVSLTFTPLSARPADDSGSHAATVGYDRAHEIAVSGTISEAIAKPELGSPVGLHLMVAGARGMVDAHLGPYMTKETQEALRAGTPVEIVGAMETVHGKQYLLARQVMVGGRVVNVRTANGFLLRVQTPNARHRASHLRTTATESNGGAR